MNSRSLFALTAPRKAPVQARSSELVASILEAALRVLDKEGPRRFTTIRVAAKAGVSVGSLYQYFPNKHAILYRLQLDEWQRTGNRLDAILADARRGPALRMRDALRWFFQSEVDEAPLRKALDTLVPVYSQAPEARSRRRSSQRIVSAFVAQAAPRASAAQRRFAAKLMLTTVTAVGQQVSEQSPGRAALRRYADATAQMILAYLKSLRA
jgi:AcrR family transcriptional regulator